MIRVRENRCGYNGYTCIGIAPLTSAFSGDEFTCYNDASPATTGITTTQIDNWYNIPESAEGFVMSVTPVPDMQLSSSVLADKVPELSCPTETANPDMFNVADYENKITAGNKTDGQTLVHAGQAGAALPCFATDGVMVPALLETMVASPFAPLTIENQTANDAYLDGIMLTLAQLTRWRYEINSRVSKLSQRVKHINSIRNMVSAMHRQSICSEFRISLISGSPLQWEGDETPRYRIEGGTAKINGIAYTVAGVTNIVPPFYAYLNFFCQNPDQTTGQYGGIICLLEFTSRGDYSMGLGGVRKVKGDREPGIPTYVLYEIVQERCEASAEMVRTSGQGVLFRNTGISPYKVLPTATCDI